MTFKYIIYVPLETSKHVTGPRNFTQIRIFMDSIETVKISQQKSVLPVAKLQKLLDAFYDNLTDSNFFKFLQISRKKCMKIRRLLDPPNFQRPMENETETRFFSKLDKKQARKRKTWKRRREIVRYASFPVTFLGEVLHS